MDVDNIADGVDVFDSSCADLETLYVSHEQRPDGDDGNQEMDVYKVALYVCRFIDTVLPTLPVTTLDPLTNLVALYAPPLNWNRFILIDSQLGPQCLPAGT